MNIERDGSFSQFGSKFLCHTFAFPILNQCPCSLLPTTTKKDHGSLGLVSLKIDGLRIA